MVKEAEIAKIKNTNINISDIGVVYTERKLMPWKHDRKPMPQNHFSYIIEGSMTLTTNGKTIEVSEGEMSFVPKGQDLHTRSRKLPFSFISIEFDAYQDEFYEFEFKNHFKVSNKEKFLNELKELYASYHDNRAGALLRQKAHLYRIFDLILKEYIQTNENYGLKKIRPAVDYMEKNYLNGYTDIKELADMCELSVSSFNRAFRSSYNTTPTKYMNLLRIERAKEYLLKTNMQIAAISEACGFSSTYYFSRLFKQITGESPLKYRQKQF